MFNQAMRWARSFVALPISVRNFVELDMKAVSPISMVLQRVLSARNCGVGMTAAIGAAVVLLLAFLTAGERFVRDAAL